MREFLAGLAFVAAIYLVAVALGSVVGLFLRVVYAITS